MSNHVSHLKAQYCRSVMRTASIGTDDESLRLIDNLATELRTSGTSADVAEAEANALQAIRELADAQHGRDSKSSGREWTQAGRAIEKWIEVSS